MLSLLPSAHKECRHLLGLVREHWQVMVAYCLYSLWTSYMLLGPIYESHREAVAAPLAIVIPYALVGAVCLALSLLFKWRRFAFDSTSHKVLTAALMTVGSVCLVVLANDRTMGTLVTGGAVYLLVYWGGLLCTAVGIGLFRIEIDRSFGWLGATKTLYVAAAGTLALLPASMLLLFVPALAGGVISILLPAVSMALLQAGVCTYPRRRYYEVDRRVELPVPTQFILTSFVQGVASGVFYAVEVVGLVAALQHPMGGSESYVSWLVGVALVLVATFAARLDYNRLLYKVGFPLVALSFVLLALLPCSGRVGGLAYLAAAAYLDVILWSLGAFIIKNMGMPACWIASFPGAALYFGTAAGALAVYLVTSSLGRQDVVTIAILLLTACAMLFASLLLLSDKNLKSGWGTFRVGSSAEDAMERTSVALVFIAREYSLTAREGEVVGLLSRGMSRREAAEALGVGEETVKTHLRGIYRKLDVHSQDELIEFVRGIQEAMREGEDGR